jgi:hypothetical protein
LPKIIAQHLCKHFSPEIFRGTDAQETSDRTVPQRAALVVSDVPVGPQSNKAPAGSLGKKIGLL